MEERDEKKEFQTHIKEPRWQQWMSVLIVFVILGAWLWMISHVRK